MKAKKIFSGLLCFMLALLLLLSGCEQKSDQDNDQAPPNADDEASSTDVGLEVGFKPSGAALSPIFCAYKSEVKEFDINAVTLEFCYGGIYASGIEHELTHGLNYPRFELFFTDESGKKYFVKSVEENLVSEKYGCYPTIDEAGKYTEINFNHSEPITIPPEMFSREIGMIRFEIHSENPRDHDPQFRSIGGVAIYYKVTDGTVTLSGKPFE